MALTWPMASLWLAYGGVTSSSVIWATSIVPSALALPAGPVYWEPTTVTRGIGGGEGPLHSLSSQSIGVAAG